MKIVLLLIATLITGCASLTGVDPKNLQSTNKTFFDFPVHISSISAKNPYGSIIENPVNVCKGRYSSIYRDDKGVFYLWPEGCNTSQTGGIWVPDNYAGQGVQFWLATQASPEMRKKSVVVGIFDPLEAGNIKKYGGEILSKPLLENIKIQSAE